MHRHSARLGCSKSREIVDESTIWCRSTFNGCVYAAESTNTTGTTVKVNRGKAKTVKGNEEPLLYVHWRVNMFVRECNACLYKDYSLYFLETLSNIWNVEKKGLRKDRFFPIPELKKFSWFLHYGMRMYISVYSWTHLQTRALRDSSLRHLTLHLIVL